MIIDLTTPKSVKIWLQERTIVRMTNMTTDVKLWSNLHGSAAAPIATYTPDANKVVLIDITDYLRTYRSSVTVCNFSYGSGSNIPLSVSIGGLISPDSVIVPPCGIGDAIIAPPSKMISAEDFGVALQMEFRDTTANASNWDLDQYEADGTLAWSGTAPQPHFALEDSNIVKIELFNSDEDNTYHTFRLIPTSCDKKYAMVEWVSFTGATRRHMFELVKYKTDNANNYSLLDIDNQYNEVKGRVDSFTIKMDGLNNYDLWYYSDVCNSSQVKVCVDGTNWHQVQVTTKSFTLPDGGASDGKLEITLNWKKYDAVAM